MSDVYVARQPIFDHYQNVFGYELLYRGSEKNAFDGTEDNLATASLIDNLHFTGFDSLIENGVGFINFPQALLIDKTPMIFAKDKLVIEVLERAEITEELVAAVAEMQKAGYTIALDDFEIGPEEKKHEAILPYVSIIKVDISQYTPQQQKRIAMKYRKAHRLLAECVETREEFDALKRMGYTLFQGYFFSKPIMSRARSINALPDNLILISAELGQPEPNYRAIAAIFKQDVALTYKLLAIANSAYFGTKRRITSVRQALVHLGVQELFKWVNLMMIRGMQTHENAELIKQSLVRGKLLSQIAHKMRRDQDEPDFFLGGLFSSLDVLLGEGMEQVLDRLPLSEPVREALSGQDNELKHWIDALVSFEHTEWAPLDEVIEESGLERSEFMDEYYDALKWQQTLS